MDKVILQQIEHLIGYKFSDISILAMSFTHSSAVDSRSASNERLEFLGDSVLGLVVCKILYERFPCYLEGDLTKIKSMLVSRRTCARISKNLGLHKYLKVGRGMTSSQALTGSLAAGLLEAVIAAIYIDGGFEAAQSFILRNFGPLFDQADAEQSQGNFKSLLQQHVQQQFNTTPVYLILDEKGPDHNKCFETEVVIGDRHFSSAWGTNKKDAEQKAAFNALVELGIVENNSEEEID